MLRKSVVMTGLAIAFGVFAACSASPGRSVFDDEGEAGGSNTGGKGGASNSGSSSSGLFNPTTGSGGSTGSGSNCATPSAVDDDMDGFSEDQGDCNDCDANVNPGAIEVVITEPDGDAGLPEPADEDCDGTKDNPLPPCDDNLAIDDFDPLHGAWAIDICQTAMPNDGKWGVLEAQYVRANGVPVNGASKQAGLLDGFGTNVTPFLGKRMLGISSGNARDAGDPGACGSQTCMGYGAGTPPNGFPQDVVGCFGGSNINDDVGLQLKLRAPKNATGFSFNFNFYSFEYPEWVCTTFNDQYISWVDPPPMGSINGNISFDANTNPVSVNVAFFQVCPGCPLGTAEMNGTGFDSWGDAGATSWLKSTAPVTGGQEFTIRFAIWDTGDSALDSTTLVDNFQWIANGGTVTVGTVIDPPQ